MMTLRRVLHQLSITSSNRFTFAPFFAFASICDRGLLMLRCFQLHHILNSAFGAAEPTGEAQSISLMNGLEVSNTKSLKKRGEPHTSFSDASSRSSASAQGCKRWTNDKFIRQNQASADLKGTCTSKTVIYECFTSRLTILSIVYAAPSRMPASLAILSERYWGTFAILGFRSRCKIAAEGS